MRVDVAVLDGALSMYGDCKSGKKPIKGEARETWVKFELSELDRNGRRNVMVTRTVSFFDTVEIYEFSVSRDASEVTLDPGVTVSVTNGRLTYRQIGGQIGPHDRGFLEVAIDADSLRSAVRGAVSIDQENWQFAVEEKGLRSEINGVAIEGGVKTKVAPNQIDFSMTSNGQRVASLSDDPEPAHKKSALGERSKGVSVKVAAVIICFPSRCYVSQECNTAARCDCVGYDPFQDEPGFCF